MCNGPTDQGVRGPGISCSICEEGFVEISKLEVHVREHFKEDSFSCSYCKNGFQLFADYTIHIKQFHKTACNFVCRYCFWEEDGLLDFIGHESSHLPEVKPFDCYICGRAFRSKELLYSHQRKCFKAGSYSCTSCNGRFSRLGDLYIHLRGHQDVPVYNCKYCNKIFTDSGTYGVHLFHFHRRKLGTQNEIVIENGLKEEQDQSKLLEILPIFNTDGESTLAQDTAILNKYGLERKFACPLCKIAFVEMNTLEIHCRLKHPGEYRVKQLENFKQQRENIAVTDISCKLCNGNFRTKIELRTHLQKAHCGKKPYKCNACNLRFVRPCTLRNHLKSHTNDHLTCKYCLKSFHQQIDLESHLETHEGESTIKCTICDIPFSNDESLKKHGKVHSQGTHEFTRAKSHTSAIYARKPSLIWRATTNISLFIQILESTNAQFAVKALNTRTI